MRRQVSPVISIHDQIANRLRAEVRSGTLAPGDPLREEQLAARFGVSRSPIRQVLQQLTYEGLLRSRPNCGMVVAEPPGAEVVGALYECRAKLETIALRQCFADLDEADFARWQAILDGLYDACLNEDHAGADYQDSLFHRVFMDKASSAGSLGVYLAIAAATRDYSIGRNRTCYDDFRELYVMHAALFAMFRLGDVEIACEALAQHILKEDFNLAACKCWEVAGRPREISEVYKSLVPMLRRAAKRRRTS